MPFDRDVIQILMKNVSSRCSKVLKQNKVMHRFYWATFLEAIFHIIQDNATQKHDFRFVISILVYDRYPVINDIFETSIRTQFPKIQDNW